MLQKPVTEGAEPAAEPLLEESHSARPRIKNILCPVGFSEFSQRAFRYATSIARHFGARLFVQHTVRRSLIDDTLGARDSLHAELQKAGIQMKQLLATARDEQLVIPPIVRVVSEGDIRQRIFESIHQHEIDLLVMGTHGRKGLDRLVHGSLTERIVHEVVCPVFVVSHPERDFITPEEIEPVSLKTILLPIDFSPASNRALTYGLHWATEWSGNLILFHAVEKSTPAMKGIVDLFPEDNPYFEKDLVEAWEKIRAQVSRKLPQSCVVTYEVRHGNAKEQILQVAAEKKPDLIVMGARGLDKSAGAWGSTISGVVRDGRFAVLGVRELVA
ncbi:MAG: universal stress protein [Acidobacteria bacterium]|nr:universal stress protein [Acidobacteriota bacterium]